eukprot:NODE_10602_length_330_cov_4.024911_g9690_i0.p1 GENE.NODE_10602_length_330_cov_4.024911_g9690_i0~~NODE_10602_length_330_cov_4.024911_g9690_i0.p1  ORF type:complete len:95 (+),score=23.68 NODE_10602_length_330_cov_4.024911_g9690_i0:29-313(+)
MGEIFPVDNFVGPSMANVLQWGLNYLLNVVLFPLSRRSSVISKPVWSDPFLVCLVSTCLLIPACYVCLSDQNVVMVPLRRSRESPTSLPGVSSA